MDIQRKAFEEKFPIPAHWIEFDKKRNKYFCPYCADAAANAYQSQWETWQAAKAQAVPEGFVLVPKEPYAYLIKHKLWNKNSQPEIYLADDFIGNDGVEKEKLTVCIPLYKGADEAQDK